jgi:hypothetical protein
MKYLRETEHCIQNKNLVMGVVICMVLFDLLIVAVNQYISSDLIQPLFATDCNCTMDFVLNGGNLTPVSMPRVNIIKNETLESQTEGNITWTGVKSVPLMNIVTDNFLLGNLSGGTSVTIALNTINTTLNGNLGIQIAGGSIPNMAKAEIVKAMVNANRTLSQVQLSEKVLELPLLHNKMLNKSSTANNILKLGISEPGYYLLVVSVAYDKKSVDNLPDTKQLIGIYQSILRVE